MLKETLSKPKFWLIVSIITSIIGATAVIGVYFFYVHWYPPLLVLTPADVGNGALIETNFGNIEVQFNKNVRFPASQFTRLAREGFYNGTRLHRIVPTLLIEGGDPLTKDTNLRSLWGQGGSASVFKNEIHNEDKMVAGTFALTGSEVDTYGSSFFILTQDTPWMKGHHTIIGKVVKGMDVVNEIKKIPTDATNFPLKDVIIYKITIL